VEEKGIRGDSIIGNRGRETGPTEGEGEKMKEITNQEEETGAPFSVLIRPLDIGKGITARDYFDALDCQVKVPLQVAYLELCELINELPKDDMDRADNFLQIQRSAFMLWEQMDKKVLEDHKAHAQA
jgi:hypothetical protein